LFPIIQGVLQQDVIEFIPYMFQILSLLLDFHVSSIPDPYMTLFPCLLVPVLWDRPANIHPLVQLLQAYISKGPQQVAARSKSCRKYATRSDAAVFEAHFPSPLSKDNFLKDHEVCQVSSRLFQRLH